MQGAEYLWTYIKTKPAPSLLTVRVWLSVDGNVVPFPNYIKGISLYVYMMMPLSIPLLLYALIGLYFGTRLFMIHHAMRYAMPQKQNTMK